ncbi:hypothetical protein F8B43_3934 [Methylorubrum populi]|uniref:Uncharacterized protein n=1 Tax=Methylorubrum populi TaxID=223967 RepID=A0A833J5P4_9HYPH|nr:hypothetical protein F8B43_3934 [Methylorubrum populi]
MRASTAVFMASTYAMRSSIASRSSDHDQLLAEHLQTRSAGFVAV